MEPRYSDKNEVFSTQGFISAAKQFEDGNELIEGDEANEGDKGNQSLDTTLDNPNLVTPPPMTNRIQE